MAGAIQPTNIKTTGAAQGGNAQASVKKAPANLDEFAVSKGDVRPEVTAKGTVHKKATHYKASGKK